MCASPRRCGGWEDIYHVGVTEDKCVPTPGGVGGGRAFIMWVRRRTNVCLPPAVWGVGGHLSCGCDRGQMCAYPRRCWGWEGIYHVGAKEDKCVPPPGGVGGGRAFIMWV